ncbi:hypothetical protein U879_15595 [Defluviimonas sp. 20V17]|uniref:PemK-like, MazF-like toxin of type II toxin-antitoxin system n=1 Tax=Allgaiera indica TaxID=765699 RepID=A0AAN4UR64_9RHOB|nr:hypothetical protein [Allgaiera indica]KDB02757.1 hypothetical protein U879_15595 [Defluviimonas sp. 20V17]GHE01884.1 hypothetical protein GCM10008024_19440 [Allgaiera indica]SDW91520.1 hypothetical protein SAMN05444006_1082 [Allgaiera indica]
MSDATTAEIAQTPATNWRDHLAWGDVVAFRFPHSERDDSYRPKVRPCAVLDVVSFAGRRFATLAYGTTADSKANQDYETRVTRPEALAAIGLDKPTRFVGSRRITVSLNNPGFSLGECGTPMLGQMIGADRERLNAVRARLFAEADMAAEHHAERRRELRDRRKADRAPLPPVVELRRPRASAAPATTGCCATPSTSGSRGSGRRIARTIPRPASARSRPRRRRSSKLRSLSSGSCRRKTGTRPRPGPSRVRKRGRRRATPAPPIAAAICCRG